MSNSENTPSSRWRDAKSPLPASIDVESVLALLSDKEKCDLLSGQDRWHTASIPRLGVSPVRMSDGPNGVRGQFSFNGTPSSCFPSSTGIAASWDVDLATVIGRALGDECVEKGVHVLLAPTVNTQRSPLGGRGFESYSEDPLLNGRMAARLINGVQQKGVIATIKHFVANDQEHLRYTIDAIVSERALREIYLKPFQIVIRESDPKALMTSYNRVNGTHASECPKLLQEILRKDWGFTGTVISDWSGAYSTCKSLLAGLDLEMPGPAALRGPSILRSLKAGKLAMSDINDRVRKVLELVKLAQQSGIPFDAPEKSLDTLALRSLLRHAAGSAIVLLKNDNGLLPLSPTVKSIAVIGPNAKVAFTSGGGAAELRPSYAISPLDGIESVAKELGIDVSYALGAPAHRFLPYITRYLRQPDGSQECLLEFWNTPFGKNGEHSEAPVYSTRSVQSKLAFNDNIPQDVNRVCWIKYSAKFVPDESGTWEFGLVLVGQGDLYLDGTRVIENTTDQTLGELFLGQGTIEERGQVEQLVAGKTYNLEVRLTNPPSVEGNVPAVESRGAMRIGAWRVISDDEAIKEAVTVAKTVEAVILVVGLSPDWECEGFDRKTLMLPGASNQLVAEVLKANPKTIVVNQSGTPIEMPWINEAHSIVQAFYGGNELGTGLADVLFGNVNPSGKLPLSFPRSISDNPSFISFPGENGKVSYSEGIYVGYRHPSFATVFPFGHGLSYASFEYSGLSLPSAISADGNFTISLSLSNVSLVAGAEVVQVYINDPESSLTRPRKELKQFQKFFLQPGQTIKVVLPLDREALGYYDDKLSSWVAEKGKFKVLVGSSSEDIRLTGEFMLEETFSWTGL